MNIFLLMLVAFMARAAGVVLDGSLVQSGAEPVVVMDARGCSFPLAAGEARMSVVDEGQGSKITFTNASGMEAVLQIPVRADFSAGGFSVDAQTGGQKHDIAGKRTLEIVGKSQVIGRSVIIRNQKCVIYTSFEPCTETRLLSFREPGKDAEVGYFRSAAAQMCNATDSEPKECVDIPRDDKVAPAADVRWD